MSLAAFATRRIQAILFVTLALCAIGAWSLRSFPVSILPDVTFPRLVVIVEAGDLPTRAVEVEVARPLEEAVATVPGVARVRTKVQRGAAELSVDFTWGADMLTAQQLVGARIAEVRGTIPPSAQISVERMNPTVFPVLGISLRSKTLSQTALRDLATYTLKPRLGRVAGVARAVVQGGDVAEMAVDVDPERLAAAKLSLDDVTQAIGDANVVRAVGRLDSRSQQYQVLVTGETRTEADLKRIVVGVRGGAPIPLASLARVHRSTEDRTTIVTADGAESVLLNIVRQPDANSVAVVAAVNDELAGLRKSLPAGVEIGVFYDQSVLIGDAIASVRDAVLIGAALSVVVLLLFLGDLRATLTTAAIIPATVLVTFLLMRAVGLTLNLMTLGALAVGIGLVIDDAIVVVENVFRHLAHGLSRADAVQRAAAEIAAPMVSSTLTTVVVFLPLVFVAGVAGAFFTALAVTLTLALLVSLALALLVSPSLCAAFLRTRPGAAEHGRLFERFVRGYERALRGSLRHRRWLLPVSLATIAAGTWLLAGRLGTGFMPAMDEGAFVLDYWTPPGTSLAESDRVLKKIEDELAKTPEVSAYSRRTGTELGFAITEANRGDFAVMLKEKRGRSIEAVIADLRGRVEEAVPGTEVEFIQVLQDLIGDLAGAPAPIEIKLFGEDQATLIKAATEVAEKLGKVKGAADVKSGVVVSGPELTLVVDPEAAGRVGLSVDALARQAQTALLGTVATRVLDGDRPIGVRVRLPAALRSNPTAVGAVTVRTPGGALLPLSRLGTVRNVAGTTEVNREDQRRLIAVTAEIEGRDLGGVVGDVQALLRETPLPPGVTVQIGGQARTQADSFANLAQVFALAVVLVFGVLLFQFGSLRAPVAILIVLPLSLFGVALALWITRTPVNVSSFMGAVMLVGIVVKNGILLLDQAQKAEADGLSSEDAVVRAGEVRLRPILMTTLTALLGLVPLALGLGAGAQMQQPLALAVIGGLTFSTVVTLVLVPMLYVSLRRKATP